MTRYLIKKNINTIAIIHKNRDKLIKLKNKRLKIITISKFTLKNLSVLKKFNIENFYFFSGYSKIPKNRVEKKICRVSNYEILKVF